MPFFQGTLTFSFLIIILFFKIIGGALVAYIYTSSYKGDTYTLMHDAKAMYSGLSSAPLLYLQFISGIEIDKASLIPYYEKITSYDHYSYNKLFKDPLFLLRINTFLCLFSFGYYYVQMLFMCFLSLVGTLALYKTAISISTCNKWLLAVSCFGIPSVIVWGSSLLKEPLILFFVGFMIYAFHKYLVHGRIKHFIFFLLFTLLLTGMKPYISIAILPGIVAWKIYTVRKKSFLFSLLLSNILTYLFVIFASLANPRYDLFHYLNNQQIIAYKNAVYYQAHSLLKLIPFAPNPISVLKHIPEGIMLCLTRPYINENHSILWQLSAMENCCVILFILILIINLDLQKINQQPLGGLSIVAGLIIIVLVAYTNPVLGTLIRLKMPGVFLLCFGLATLSKSSKEKLKSIV